MSETVVWDDMSDEMLMYQDEALGERYWDLQDEMGEIVLARAAVRGIISRRRSERQQTSQA